MIPMPNSGLADPVNQGARYGFGAGAAFAVRSLGYRRLVAGLGRLSGAKAISWSDRGSWVLRSSGCRDGFRPPLSKGT